MSYSKVDEPFAQSPTPTDYQVAGDWSDAAAMEIDLDSGELSWQRLDSATIDLAGLSHFEIDHCHLKDVAFVNTDATETSLRESIVEGSDLSRLRVTSVEKSQLIGVKWVGTDFSGASLTDTTFDGCVLRMANLRMSRLRRVAFEACTINDVDAYAAELEDVHFDQTELRAFSIDRVTATRVDLRGCTSVGLTAIGRLDGFLASGDQLFALAPQLAHAAGLIIHDE